MRGQITLERIRPDGFEYPVGLNAKSLTVDYLVVAGGSGGGFDAGGAGGAGGLRSTVTATGGGGSLESPLSLALNTNYTPIVSQDTAAAYTWFMG